MREVRVRSDTICAQRDTRSRAKLRVVQHRLCYPVLGNYKLEGQGSVHRGGRAIPRKQPIVAERRLELRKNGRARPVTVRLHRPQRDPLPGGDWMCVVEIQGIPGRRPLMRASYGVDQMQALLLAFELMRLELRLLQGAQRLTRTAMQSLTRCSMRGSAKRSLIGYRQSESHVRVHAIYSMTPAAQSLRSASRAAPRLLSIFLPLPSRYSARCSTSPRPGTGWWPCTKT